MLTKLERGKLIIGGAQLGNKYGITNNKKVSLEDTTKILNYAKRKNINYLDLAESYNSHEKLKKIKLNNFKIIFKLNFKKKNIKENYIKKKFFKILKTIKLKKIYCVMLHDTANYNLKELDIIFNTFQNLKKKKLVKKIGFSTYGQFMINKIISNYNIDVIQTTFNFFDNRILKKKIWFKLKQKKVSIHARSIFLQGVLLKQKDELPKKLTVFYGHFFRWHKFLDLNKISSLDACVNYVLNKNFDKIILGVNNLQELKDILSIKKKKINKQKKLISNNLSLINPYEW